MSAPIPPAFLDSSSAEEWAEVARALRRSQKYLYAVINSPTSKIDPEAWLSNQDRRTVELVTILDLVEDD